MSDLKSDGQALQPQRETANESAETRVFDSDQILRASMPRPGLTLRERYRLENEIGRGAMGVVFRATDLELLRPVAVKVLAERLSTSRATQEESPAPDAGETPAVPVRAGSVPAREVAAATGTSDQRSRFMREARAAAALNHPHIVAIYDVGEDRGFPFFVMELVDGPNLGQKPPHDLQDVVEVAAQICAALEHAHGNAIVHRDLKPANVMLSGAGVKLPVAAGPSPALPTRGEGEFQSHCQ
jgi:serine/threonine-protein kinase